MYLISSQFQFDIMKLQLSVQIPIYPFKIHHDQKIFFTGSCFSEHISEQMSQHGFFVASNPWGILFNPISMGKLIHSLLQDEFSSSVVLPVYREKRWFSLHQHSQLNATSEEELIQQASQIHHNAKAELETSEVLIFTFGTAMVYEHLESGEVVANCQKIPQNQFRKRFLSIDEIVEYWSSIIGQLQDKKIIFTVSPVRHSKDGLIENNQSKAILILAIQKLMHLFPANCYYFPSYEIILDELRDYRFFESDMVHPTALAVKYVWEKWCTSLMALDTQNMAMEFNKLYLFSQHKPMYGDVELHMQQVSNMIEKCKIAYPNMNYLKIIGKK